MKERENPTEDRREPPRIMARRRDRAVDDQVWIEDFLARAPMGTLAISSNGSVRQNSNIFVYDRRRQAIYFHTARLGQTRSDAEGGAEASFSAGVMGRLLPAKEALEFSVEYASVQAFGRVSVVEDREEIFEILQALLDKYAPHLLPGKDYSPSTDQDLRRTSVFRFDIESWSGKRKVVEEDFPGAYTYDPGSLLRPLKPRAQPKPKAKPQASSLKP